MQAVEVIRASLSSPQLAMLIEELNAELTALYPEDGANFFELHEEEVSPGRGVALMLVAGGVALGCGALRRLNETDGEIKRMYVAQSARGKGLGRLILESLEAEALSMGLTQLLLETGERQPAALGLYASCGFRRCPPFGQYVGNPFSVCMSKVLQTG